MVAKRTTATKRRRTTAKPVWRKDRITSEVDESTGRRIVDTKFTVAGMTPAQVNAVYAFEAENLGTVKAILRMQKREVGSLTTLVPARLASVTIPAAIRKFYVASDEADAE